MHKSGDTKPPLGTVMIALALVPSFRPFNVSGWVIVTCSGYVPGQTFTVEFGVTAATAAEIVE